MTIGGSTLYEQADFVSSIHADEYAAASSTNGDEVAIANRRRALVALMVGALGASATLDVHIEYKDSAGAWQNLLGEDGATQVAFAQVTDDAANENKVYIGEIPIEAIPSGATALRAVGDVATQVANYSVMFMMGDLYEYPSGTTNLFDSIIGVGARDGTT